MSMQIIDDKNIIEERYSDHLSDESRMMSETVKRIYFPQNEEDVSAALQEVAERNEKVTLSGGRTGIVGGAVASGAQNLISMDACRSDYKIGYDENKGYYARVSAGMRLDEFYDYLACADYTFLDEVSQGRQDECGELFFPVNPTEPSAQIGGIASANASGARSVFYGSTRDWVRGLKVVLADGRIFYIRRGEYVAADGCLQIEDIVIDFDSIVLPETKRTLGLHLTDELDAVDLFIGSEGILGVITEVELYLIPKPANMLAMIIYCSSRDQLTDLLKVCKGNAVIKPQALEYFDENALSLLRQRRKDDPSSNIAKIPGDAFCALYIESVFRCDNDLELIYEELESAMASLGISDDSCWAGFDADTFMKMAIFRHAVPESVNSLISERRKKYPEIRKLSTDMAVPFEQLDHMLDYYEAKLDSSNLESVIFGHIGDAHLHVNILPKNPDEVEKAKIVFMDFAKEAVRLNGSVSAEHGIGRLKRELLKVQFSSEVIKNMIQVKKTLDPKLMLNIGVVFDVNSYE